MSAPDVATPPLKSGRQRATTSQQAPGTPTHSHKQKAHDDRGPHAQVKAAGARTGSADDSQAAAGQGPCRVKRKARGGDGSGEGAGPDGGSSTPSKTPYAGPTFHASPAPSALPIPKFLASPVVVSATVSEAADLKAADPKAAEDEATVENAGPAAVGSPLDFIFKAHRSEQEARGHRSPAKETSQAGTPLASSAPMAENVAPSSYIGHSQNSSQQRRSDRSASQTGSPFQANITNSATSPQYAVERHERTPTRATGPAIPQPGPDKGSAARDIQSAPTNKYAQSLIRNLVFASNPTVPPDPPQRQDSQRTASAPVSLQPQPADLPSSKTNSEPRKQLSATVSNTHTEQLHYGNRNLSPLFRAAKGHVERPASGLRKEMSLSSIHGPNSRLQDGVSSPSKQALQQEHAARAASDADTISRNYLNAHIAAAEKSLDLPYLLRRAVSEASEKSMLASSSTGDPKGSPSPTPTRSGATKAANSSNPSLGHGRSSSNETLKSKVMEALGLHQDDAAEDRAGQNMEDDLRKMLNVRS